MTDMNDKFPLYTDPFDVMIYAVDHSSDLINCVLIAAALVVLYYLTVGEDK